ncbi:MAG TPA: ribose 5-phosphate isomerase B [Firmicutes bacterium]|nr:ribose 5-phosphate isomerase B [Bacillota bacterium]
MIAIGCDKAGINLMKAVIEHLKSESKDVKCFGITEDNPVDYPEIAFKVANSVASGECKYGILICGTGIGMSMAANKVKGIRAAVCSEHYSAKYTRLHNDANILCLGGRVIGEELAKELVDVFLNTEFEGGRHLRRVNYISDIENGRVK